MDYPFSLFGLILPTSFPFVCHNQAELAGVRRRAAHPGGKARLCLLRLLRPHTIVNPLAMYGYIPGRFDSNPHLITSDVHHRDGDFLAHDQRLTNLPRQNQHVSFSSSRLKSRTAVYRILASTATAKQGQFNAKNTHVEWTYISDLNRRRRSLFQSARFSSRIRNGAVHAR